ncbi:conserved hypothetical protein [Ricinus communis]|uniref:Uncharacterized protein n=1 Tax=Ricinus communis TaxID=3988 RepID=B9RZP2_RICCO|nr:conserved hypothetical protein [Ricinus communis]
MTKSRIFFFQEFMHGMPSSLNKTSESMETGKRREELIIHGGDDYVLYHNDSLLEGCIFSDYPQQESYSDCRRFSDDPSFSIFSHLQFPPWPDQAAEIQNGIQDNYGNEFNRLNTERSIKPSHSIPFTEVAGQGLSTEEIKRQNMWSLLNFFLASAEKVSNGKFDRASRLLEFCDQSSSNAGNPVQRVVYYFFGALRRRIDQELGKITSRSLVIIPNPSIQACFEGIPFYQAAHLTGIKAIIENVAEANRSHLLKITAVETTSKHLIEETEVKEDLIEIDTKEVVAVYSEYALMNFIVLQDQLGEGFRNTVATEGEDRDIRNVKLDVWRNFFTQCG